MSRRFRDLIVRRLDAALADPSQLISEDEFWLSVGDAHYARELAPSHAGEYVKSRKVNGKEAKVRRGA